MADLRAEVDEWIAATWDPDERLGDWWRRLAAAGYAAPHWPKEWFGLGVTAADARVVRDAIRAAAVPGPPAGLGMMLAGPTLLTHGSDEQRACLLPGIVDGTENWCQLFSEPGAGSDLAGLSTRAQREGDYWMVSGQKVWTSNGHLADYGMLLARTDPSSSGRDGITWFVLSMDQPGVDVRPLREMTGRSLFSEVFLDDALVTEADVVGELGGGWTVARATLAFERAGLGEGGAGGGAPGRKSGMLDQRCGDVAERLRTPRRRSGTAAAMRAQAFDAIIAAARSRGVAGDVLVRQDLARLYTLERLATLAYATVAARGVAAASSAPATAKLRQGAIVRLARDLALRVLGAEGMLASGDRSDVEFLCDLALFSPAVSIYGGTDEIQRNMLAERVLGLPRT